MTAFVLTFLLQVRIVFWNLENLFDYKTDSVVLAGGTAPPVRYAPSELSFPSKLGPLDGLGNGVPEKISLFGVSRPRAAMPAGGAVPPARQREFSPSGEKRWTGRKFYRKCSLVAKGIFWIADRYGGLPDIVAVAEVENGAVLSKLLWSTPLGKAGYRYVHYDSPDPRGVDVALLYRPGTLRLIDSKPCHVGFPTRDILLCRFLRDTSEFAVLVNHHPSKYGGTLSEPRRAAAVRRMKEAADSLMDLGVPLVIACGDFNDTPDSPAFSVLSPSFRLLSEDLYNGREGTIRFNGSWELIDLFYGAPASAFPDSSFRVFAVRIPFLMVRDRTHPGEKPLRTYSGPRYLGGVSDHLPVYLQIH